MKEMGNTKQIRLYPRKNWGSFDFASEKTSEKNLAILTNF